jgi:tetratricopeptide (TPR) repeat protein
MPKIFISYRRADSRKDASRIYDRLVQAFGVDNVFMDVNNDNIPLGRDFRGVLRESVARCDVLLALIGKSWLNITDDQGQRRLDNPNDFVRIEIESALQRDRCLVIPVTLDNAFMPGAKDLPEALKELSYKNAAVVREDPDFHPDVNRIIRALENAWPQHKASSFFTQTPPAPNFNVYLAINRYNSAFESRNWEQARSILNEIRASGEKLPRTFNIDALERDLHAEIALEEREHEYNVIRQMAKAQNPNAVRIGEALQVFWQSYPHYDPDNLTRFRIMKAEDFFNRGEDYRKKGDYNRAIADYTEAIRLSPQLTQAYNGRGISFHHGKQDYDRAIAEYTEAIRINPHSSNSYNNRGFTYHHGKQDYDRAIADFNQAIRINPQNAAAYNNRGSVYTIKKNYDQAIADFTEAIRINPQHATTYYNRGNCYREKQDYDLAIADYTTAIHFNPQYANAYNHRGNCHFAKQDYDRAIIDYEAALRNDANHFFAAQSLHRARDLRDVLRQLKK